MDTRVHSSSASGYLILSKLHDSSHTFPVGFPQNKWPEQKFSVSINQKDHGYLLKNFGEKGWGLFDLQTLAVQMATSGSAKVETKKMEENKDVSRFADLLSRASDDPSLKEKPAQTSVQSKNETVVQEMVINQDNKEKSNDSSAIKPVEIVEQPVIKKEELQVNKQEQHEVLTQEIVNPVLEQFKPSIITKRSESSTTEGFGLVFIDDIGNGINDTIRLLIPNPKTSLTFIKEEPKPEKKFIDILPDTVKKKEEQATDTNLLLTETPVEKKTSKNNCLVVADENDFYQLRKNMAAAVGDENMLSEAKNYFMTKCFATEQIKNLGLLFLNEKGRFDFFDLAYTYVTDPDKFTVLQSELKDSPISIVSKQSSAINTIMPRYFLEVAYKGTNYSGFQSQQNANTIQAEVEKAFSVLQKEKAVMTGSSRTDAGVHALQNFFHFDSEKPVMVDLVYKMNAILPGDIVVKRLIAVNEEAHCRFDAISREYRYYIYRSKNPFLKDTAYYYPYKLDIDKLKLASDILKKSAMILHLFPKETPR